MYHKKIAIEEEKDWAGGTKRKRLPEAYTPGKRGMDAVIRLLAKEAGAYNITVN